MGLIPEEKIAEIRDRIDIISVIGEHVALRRAGVNHLGLCPFHAEKTPSFNVNASKQFFYCFGCQKSGDVFRFLMEVEGRSFAEVARDLARRAGVDIPETTGQDSPERLRQRRESEDERAKLLRLHEIAATWFQAQLKKTPLAQRYLEARAISDKTQEKFRLGYAPEGWDGLLRVFEQKGVPWELYERSGLGIRRERAELPRRGGPATKQSHYDRFRERIIFPLIAPSGDVIAFGGRVLPGEGGKDKEGAKYINSPESPIYKKGDNLYGLHAARDPIRKGHQVVLVEGNFDVLALHEHGVDNAVAPMGTALTDTQVRLLKRLLGSEGHVALMLDGDRAGRSATLKDIWLFSQANIDDMARFTGQEIDIRVAQLPDGEDPDTYVAKDRAGFDRRLKTAKPAVDYVLDEAIKLAEHDNVAGKAKVLMQVAPLLRAVGNPTTRAMYVDRLARELAISSAIVWQSVQNQAPRAPAPEVAPARPSAPPRPAAQIDSVELKLVSLCGDHPPLLTLLSDELLDRLQDQSLGEMLREARAAAGEGPLTAYQLIELAPPELRDAVASAALAGTFSQLDHPERALSQIEEKISARFVDRELEELNRALVLAVRADDLERKKEIHLRMQELRSLKAGHAGPRP